MSNEILQEIYRIREEHARQCDFNTDVMFARMEEGLKQLKADGWNLVSADERISANGGHVLRELPAKRESKN